MALLVSTLILGFLGSWHCGIMCGPISCNFKVKKQFLTYHLGRLVSYLVVATILYIGSHFLLEAGSRNFKMTMGLVFALFFCGFGLAQLGLIDSKKMNFKYFKFQISILNRFRRISESFPLVLGL